MARCWLTAILLTAACLSAPGPAIGAVHVAPGRGEVTGMVGGCDPEVGSPCAYVQAAWDAVKHQVGADSLPFTTAGVLTRIRMHFHSPGRIRLRVVRWVQTTSTEPTHQTYEYAVVASWPWLDVAAGWLDEAIRLPVRPGDAVAVSLDGGARPSLVYEDGSRGPGQGTLLHASADGEDRLFAEHIRTPDQLDGISFDALLEPDADGDGMGDETQDRPPVSASPQEQPAGPAPGAGGASPHPSQVMRDVRLRHRRLLYTLTRRVRLLAIVRRRVHGRWITQRRLRIPGTPGRHVVRLPVTPRRVVLEARDAQRRILARVRVRPAES